jgi:hypothetical protein
MSGLNTYTATFMTATLSYQLYFLFLLIGILIMAIGSFLYGIYSTYQLVKIRAQLVEMMDTNDNKKPPQILR